MLTSFTDILIRLQLLLPRAHSQRQPPSSHNLDLRCTPLGQLLPRPRVHRCRRITRSQPTTSPRITLVTRSRPSLRRLRQPRPRVRHVLHDPDDLRAQRHLRHRRPGPSHTLHRTVRPPSSLPSWRSSITSPVKRYYTTSSSSLGRSFPSRSSTDCSAIRGTKERSGRGARVEVQTEGSVHDVRRCTRHCRYVCCDTLRSRPRQLALDA
jgi:hypothetical protein